MGHNDGQAKEKKRQIAAVNNHFIIICYQIIGGRVM